MASKSALFAQIQANIRAAAQRAKEREDDIGEPPPESQEPEAPAEPANQEPLAAALPAIQFEPQEVAIPQVLSGMERRMHSLSEVSVELLKALIKSKGFINITHIDLHGKRGKIPYATIRSAVNRLDKEGFFDYRGVGNYGMLKGMSYSLNKEMVEAFLSVHGGEPKDEVSEHQIKLPEAEQPTAVLDHPELKAWKDSGLSEKQINAWCAEFEVDKDLMAQYLKWCAYDVANNHSENPVKNMANWFYVMLRNTGSYPKPDGYVSMEDRRLRQLEELRAEQAERKQRETQAMQDSIDSDLKEYFDKMLVEGEANDLYVELRGTINDFSRRLEKVPGNPVFRAAMWAAFRNKAGV